MHRAPFRVAALLLAFAPAYAPSQAAPPPSPAPQVTGFESRLQAAGSAYDAQQYHLAATLYAQIVRENPVNPDYWRRLAAAHYLAAEYAASIPAYRMALQLRQDQPATLAYYLARAYAKAGDPVTGMRWLRQAMAWGYVDLAGARTDAAVALMGTQPGFDDLLGIVDASKLSRVAGWRYDLAFLARWVKAKAYHPFRTDTGDRFVSSAAYTQAEFDARVADLNRKIPSMSDVEIELALMRVVASLGDGHTELGGGPRPEYAQTLPVKFALFADGLYIVAADPAYRSLLGAQVLAFDGHRTASVLAAVAPYVSRDNAYWLAAVEPYRLRAIPFLRGLGVAAHSDRVTLRVRNLTGGIADSVVAVTTDHPDIWNTLPSPSDWINLFQTLPAAAPLYLTRTNEHYWFTYQAARKLIYFQYNNVIDEQAEPLAAFSVRLGSFLTSHDVDKLVIDMRWNNGGDTFLNEPLLRTLECSSINRPGHLFVIVGPRTFSAGLNAAEYFRRSLHAIFFGEPTGGKPNAPGDETFFTLPYSKIAVNFSSVYWESGRPQDAEIALAPDVYTPLTFASYRNGDDPALDAILGYR